MPLNNRKIIQYVSHHDFRSFISVFILSGNVHEPTLLFSCLMPDDFNSLQECGLNNYRLIFEDKNMKINDEIDLCILKLESFFHFFQGDANSKSTQCSHGFIAMD